MDSLRLMEWLTLIVAIVSAAYSAYASWKTGKRKEKIKDEIRKHNSEIRKHNDKIRKHNDKIRKYLKTKGSGAMKDEYDERLKKLRAHINEAQSSFYNLHRYIYRKENKVLRKNLRKDKEQMDDLKYQASVLYDLIAKICVGEQDTDSAEVEHADKDNPPKLEDDSEVQDEPEHGAVGEGERGEFALDKDPPATEGPGQEEPKPSTEPDPAGTSAEGEDAAEP